MLFLCLHELEMSFSLLVALCHIIEGIQFFKLSIHQLFPLFHRLLLYSTVISHMHHVFIPIQGSLMHSAHDSSYTLFSSQIICVPSFKHTNTIYLVECVCFIFFFYNLCISYVFSTHMSLSYNILLYTICPLLIEKSLCQGYQILLSPVSAHWSFPILFWLLLF